MEEATVFTPPDDHLELDVTALPAAEVATRVVEWTRSKP